MEIQSHFLYIVQNETLNDNINGSASEANTCGSFRVKSTNASSMTISDFLHFAVYERHIIQEQNKKKLNLISPS